MLGFILYQLFFYEQSSSATGIIVGSLVTFVVTLLLLQFFVRILMNNVNNSLLSNDNIIGEPIKNKALINHFRGIISDGGVGYLLSDKLVFIPHKLNFTHEKITVVFSEIESVSDFKLCGFLNIGLKILIKSGKTERFVIDKKSLFYKNLKDALEV
jgi:hypothetical protein